jgi:chorismate dehydratase
LARLRVGIVNYLNSKPLAWGFLKGRHDDLFEPSSHPPARVAELLAAGEIAVGLIPSIEVQRIPDLRVIPDLCVAATREVRSVLLVSRVPLADIQEVALDENSRTSAALVRIVLEDGHGVRPRYRTARADLDSMLANADAALLIGDPALKVDRERYRILDLAAEWRRLSGHPFVFAVWAAAPGVDLPELPSYFQSSLRYGLASLEPLVREAAAELDLGRAEVHDYLTQALTYVLGPDEIAGLEEFYRRAAAKGLIPAPRPLEFWSAPAAPPLATVR